MRTMIERAAAVATAAAGFPEFLGPVSVDDLRDLVSAELGDAGALDGYVPHGTHLARAIAPDSIVHVVAGNSPHGALQSLVRGVLLGSRNRVKLPAAGLPEVAAFCDALPPALRDRIELASDLPDAWLREAGAVVVYGRDETLADLRRRVPPGVTFQAHGHRVSFGVVFRDAEVAVARAARDVSLFDQHGCLSPHAIFVAPDAGMEPREFAARLADAMAEFQKHTPRRKLSVSESAELVDLRANYAFRSASDVRTQIWSSPAGTDWTVVFEEDFWWATSPLNRFVFVKPLPPDLATWLEPIRPWLGAIGIWPARPEFAARVDSLGASRICPLGRMQFPALTWHAEGKSNLADLVRWVDFENESG